MSNNKEDFDAQVSAFKEKYPDFKPAKPIEVLNLIMTRKNAKEILEGKKKVEYRAYTDHYIGRLFDKDVLEIALEGKNLNRNRPQNYSYSTISYSSTHDCKPLKGFLDDLDEKELIETEKTIASLSRHFGVTYTSTRTRKDDVKALLRIR